MSDESMDFILNARDNASGVFRKTAAELELLRDQVQQTSNNAKQGTDVVDKFARLFGMGEFANAAADIKSLAGGIGDATKAMKAGGAASLAMKAGLVGLTAVISYKVGEIIANWVFETKKFTEELKKSAEAAKELGRSIDTVTNRRIDQQIADIKEFGGSFEEQAKAAQELVSQLNREIGGKDTQEAMAKADLERLENQRAYYIASQEEVDSAKANLEIIQQSNKALKEKRAGLQQEFSEASGERQRRRENIEQEKIREQERVNFIVEGEKKRQKIAEERAKYEQQQIEKEQKLREQAFRKQQDKEIKAAADTIKATEKSIADLDKISASSGQSSLTSADERMTSLARNSGTMEFQALEQAKKQVKLMELNQKLQQQNARYLQMIAEKEDQVVDL